MNHYFSSDYHFGHKNIIEYDERPFKDVEEMDETLIQNHNSVVKREDYFYYLGDFAFCKPERAEYLMLRLNGNKVFVKGNHDHEETVELYKKHGDYRGDLTEVTIESQLIVLCHFPFEAWNQSHRKSWHLHGHLHCAKPDPKDKLSIDVGCNGWHYHPLEFQEIKKIMQRKSFNPSDYLK